MDKVSSRGVRRCRSLAEKRALLARQRESGLAVGAFCRREGVGVSTFHQWKRALGVPSADGATAFIEALPATSSAFPASAPVAPAPEAVAVEVTLPGGVRLATSSACDPAWLAALLRAAVPC